MLLFPLCDARKSGLTNLLLHKFTTAPFFNKIWTILSRPFWQALDRGLKPSVSKSLMHTFSFNKHWTSAWSPLSHAAIRAEKAVCFCFPLILPLSLSSSSVSVPSSILNSVNSIVLPFFAEIEDHLIEIQFLSLLFLQFYCKKLFMNITFQKVHGHRILFYLKPKYTSF